MKTFLIAAMTADGLIGRDANHLANWSSQEDKKLFVRLTKQAGVLIMGNATFKTIGRPLPDRRNIIYSRQPGDDPGVEYTREPPAALLTRLAHEGHQEAAICGGRSIYDLFLQAGLVNELYITVEPLLFGQGVTLAASPLEASLRLREVAKLNDNTVLLHYEVQK